MIRLKNAGFKYEENDDFYDDDDDYDEFYEYQADDEAFFIKVAKDFNDKQIQSIIDLKNAGFIDKACYYAAKNFNGEQIETMIRLKGAGFSDKLCYDAAKNFNGEQIDNMIRLKGAGISNEIIERIIGKTIHNGDNNSYSNNTNQLIYDSKELKNFILLAEAGISPEYLFKLNNLIYNNGTLNLEQEPTTYYSITHDLVIFIIILYIIRTNK